MICIFFSDSALRPARLKKDRQDPASQSTHFVQSVSDVLAEGYQLSIKQLPRYHLWPTNPALCDWKSNLEWRLGIGVCTYFEYNLQYTVFRPHGHVVHFVFTIPTSNFVLSPMYAELSCECSSALLLSCVCPAAEPDTLLALLQCQ